MSESQSPGNSDPAVTKHTQNARIGRFDHGPRSTHRPFLHWFFPSNDKIAQPPDKTASGVRMLLVRAVAALLVAGSCMPAAWAQSANFTSHGFYYVPAGVFQVRVKVDGGGGGGGGADGRPGGAGGSGARVFATLPVTPGEQLIIRVGTGAGGAGTGACAHGTPGGDGWRNGGFGGDAGCVSYSGAGGGGGAGSAVYRSGRLLVGAGGGAGGGGGSSYYGGLAGLSADRQTGYFGNYGTGFSGMSGEDVSRSVDGGGGGGGGGGCEGGRGGDAHNDSSEATIQAVAGTSCVHPSATDVSFSAEGGSGGLGGVFNGSASTGGGSGSVAFFIPDPALTLLLTAPPEAAGDLLIYSFEIKNSGPRTSGEDITIQNQLAPGAYAKLITAGTGTSAVDCGPIPSGDGALITCRLKTTSGGIPVGSSARFSVNVDTGRVVQGSHITNFASMNRLGVGVPSVKPGLSCLTNSMVSCAAAGTKVALSSPEVKQAFVPAIVESGEYSLLTVTILNTDAAFSIRGVQFTSSYPANLRNAASPMASVSGCVSATLHVTTTVALDGLVLTGAVIPPGGTCRIQVRVLSEVAGQYAHTLEEGSVTADNAHPNLKATTATLSVTDGGGVLPPPRPISCQSDATVFNTGNAAPGGSLSAGSRDVQWLAAFGAPDGDLATVGEWRSAYLPGNLLNDWSQKFGSNGFISVDRYATSRINSGFFRYDFVLASNVDAASFVLGLNIRVDNSINAVYVNGVLQPVPGVPASNPNSNDGFSSSKTLNIASGWKPGNNSLILNVRSATDPGGGTMGLFAQVSSRAACLKPTLTISAVGNDQAGAYLYRGNNGLGVQVITTVASGVAAQGEKKILTDFNAATTITQSPSALSRLVDIRCTNMGTGGTAKATFNADGSGSILLDAAAIANNRDISCTFVNAQRAVVTGRVFLDTGSGTGAANNGIINEGEQGIAEVPVVLTDCAAATFAEARTSGDGRYSLDLPDAASAGTRLCVDVARSPDRQPTGASVGISALVPGRPLVSNGIAHTYLSGPTVEQIQFARPVIGTTSARDLNFAVVPNSTFVGSGLQGGQAGTSVVYPHVFVAGTQGQVSFSVPHSSAMPPFAGWRERVFADIGCTARLQEGAAVLYPPAVPVAVGPGQMICVVLQQTIPPTAAVGARNEVTLEAGLVFSNASPALVARYVLKDLTTTTIEALSLLKEVRNVTQGATAFGATNQARPGDTLEYRISYRNLAPVAVSGLVINDNTPAYTRLVDARADRKPSALLGCSKTTPAAPGIAVDCSVVQSAGGQGPIEWAFQGSLQPGETGSVFFQVKVD